MQAHEDCKYSPARGHQSCLGHSWQYDKTLWPARTGVNSKGAEIVAKLTRDRSLNTWSKLLKSDIECALAYKAIELPKNAKKPELLQLLLNNICSLDNVCSAPAESSANTPEKVASASDTDSSSDCDSEHSDDSHIEIYLLLSVNKLLDFYLSQSVLLHM